ncbi:hypothetical protein Bca4012_012843 [Brassica carinata]
MGKRAGGLGLNNKPTSDNHQNNDGAKLRAFKYLCRGFAIALSFFSIQRLSLSLCDQTHLRRFSPLSLSLCISEVFGHLQEETLYYTQRQQILPRNSIFSGCL